MPDLTADEIARTDFGTYTEAQFLDDMARVTEYRCDPDLTEILVKRSLETLVWMRSKGVRFTAAWGRQAFNVGGRFKFWGGLTVEAVGGGPGLVESLTQAAGKNGIEIWYEARAKNLIFDDEGVKGVQVRRKGKSLDVRAKAVVLAAGEGTRLRPFTETQPKVMLPVANRPILEHVLRALAEAGVREAALVVGYRHERVRDHFGDGRRLGLHIRYIEQSQQLGTGHALLQAQRDRGTRQYRTVIGGRSGQSAPGQQPGQRFGLLAQAGELVVVAALPPRRLEVLQGLFATAELAGQPPRPQVYLADGGGWSLGGDCLQGVLIGCQGFFRPPFGF